MNEIYEAGMIGPFQIAILLLLGAIIFLSIFLPIKLVRNKRKKQKMNDDEILS